MNVNINDYLLLPAFIKEIVTRIFCPRYVSIISR